MWKKVLIGALIFIGGAIIASLFWRFYVIPIFTKNPVEVTAKYNQCVYQYESYGKITTIEEAAKADKELIDCLGGVFGGKAIWTTEGWK